MSTIDKHPILGQLNETQRRYVNVNQLQEALAQRRKIMNRDGKLTTVVAGIIGISGLFFMKPLPFYIVLGLLVIGLPMVWNHLLREAREFSMSDKEIETILEQDDVL